MAKQTQATTTGNRTPKSTATTRNKARRVAKSNGLQFFKEWVNKDATGGRKKKGSRPSARAVDSKLCDSLIRKYEAQGRKMDLPKPEKKPQEENDG